MKRKSLVISSLSDKVITKKDKTDLEMAITMMQQVQKLDATSLDRIKAQISLRSFETLEQYLDFSSTQLQEDLGKISLFLKTMSVARLTVAYTPNGNEVDSLLKKIRQRINSNVVLEIIYEPTILAGFVLEWNGTRQDSSLQTHLDSL